ncbi:MAG: serine/threonine-protein phosphatase [Ruminococcus flavefaciens]|nr:serine/threonine-protein phosphatase [Ruminococcus flavefaciens]
MSWFKKNKHSNKTVAPITDVPDRLTYLVGNLQGIGTRARQEDSFTLSNALDKSLYDDKGLLLCVCDGMGGMKDGKLASETAVAEIRKMFSSLDTTADISAQLISGAYQATDSIQAKLDGIGGSTIVACVIINEQLYYISVGDSFLYLFRNGKLIKINTEHNLCHQMYLENIHDGCLDALECRNDPEANVLTSFLGIAGDLTIDYNASPIPLIKDDVLLVCSDGVGGTLDNDKLVECLNCISVNQMCINIENGIAEYSNPNQDNYTAVVLKCI